ncbi:MAG: TonB-dependent receptor [Bacteroidetes bacterium QS_9_68_14]|nr:MAG: TonB-dependent receptor [Bacteroidetes bacterium QS_9_68_14]
MAVLLAALSLLLAAPASHAGASHALRDTVVRDTVRRDTVRRDTLARRAAADRARLDTVPSFPEVTVTAPPAVLAGGRRRTALSAEDMEAAGAQSVADLLEARTGFFVRHYGAGGLATASLRGTSSQQTLFLLDGQRLADPQTGQVDLSLLPTALLQSASVSHGAASARHGSGAFGGVVRLRTLPATQALRYRAVGEASAWGERAGSMVLRGGGEHLAGLVAGEWSGSDGDFPYDADARSATPGRRSGAGRHRRTLVGKARYQRGAHDALAMVWLADAERGLPGRINTSPSRARQWDRHARLQLRDRWAQPWGQLQLSARAQSTWRRYRDPAPTNPTARTDDTTRTRTLTFAAQAQTQAGSADLTGGLELGLDRARTRGGVQRKRAAGFLDATFQFGRGAVHPALRLDALASGGGPSSVALSPRLAANFQPTSYDALRLKASVGRSFRAPTFSERFREPGGTPDLRPESGWSADAALAWRVDHGRWSAQAEATAFAMRMTDRIVWQPTYVGAGVQVWRPRNVGTVATRGLELSAQGEWALADGAALSGGFLFTHTRTEDRSNPVAPAFGHQLPHRPEQQLKLNVGAAVALGSGRLRAGLNGRLVGPRYVTTDESDAQPAYQVVDARLRYARDIGPLRVGLGAWLENATAEDYQIVRFYPMPPRHLRLRLTIETDS